jgi:IclR family pca regulon transcriptional regulator
MRDRNHIKSLERGLEILEIFGQSSRPLTLTQIANLAKLNKTATQRFLRTLCSLNYLYREENKHYVLASRVLSLGYSFLNSSNIATKCKPFLDELSFKVDKTVNLAVLDNIDTLFLYRREVRKFLKYDLAPGSKLPAHAGALGKMLLAGLNDKELKKRLDKMDFHPLTAKTVSSKQTLLEEIKKIRQRGYSICDQELSMDLYSVAVPLLDDRMGTVAAINVSMEYSFKGSSNLAMIIASLIETGEKISRILGYQDK